MAEKGERIHGAAAPEGPRIEISLDALEHNLESIRAAAPDGNALMAVVKDSAYGCGALPIARFLRTKGVAWFVVARICEARALREGGIDEPVLVLGTVDRADLPWAAHNDVTLSLNDIATLDAWRRAPHDAAFHCNVDSGMGRMGLAPEQIPRLAAALDNTRLRLTGLYTHFACADEPGTVSVGRQLSVFESARRCLIDKGVAPPLVHCANSAGIANFAMPEWTTHVRPGIALYGCRPDPRTPVPLDLRPVASLIGRVVKVKPIAAGTPVSYGWRYRADHDTYIATVDVGYAHGVPRFLSGRGAMLVRGEARPVAGRVTMDFTMLDIGPKPVVRPGDEAVVMGVQGARAITPDDVALIGDTIGYEVLCNLSTRLPRLYRYGGDVVGRIEGRCW